MSDRFAMYRCADEDVEHAPSEGSSLWRLTHAGHKARRTP